MPLDQREFNAVCATADSTVFFLSYLGEFGLMRAPFSALSEQ